MGPPSGSTDESRQSRPRPAPPGISTPAPPSARLQSACAPRHSTGRPRPASPRDTRRRVPRVRRSLTWGTSGGPRFVRSVRALWPAEAAKQRRGCRTGPTQRAKTAIRVAGYLDSVAGLGKPRPQSSPQPAFVRRRSTGRPRPPPPRDTRRRVSRARNSRTWCPPLADPVDSSAAWRDIGAVDAVRH